MSKIVITGATGAIAVSLAKLAINRGDEVFVIAHRGSKRLSNIPSGAHVFECDLSDYSTFCPDFKADKFFHLAWDKTSVGGRDDTQTQMKNIEWTLDAVDLAARLGCTAFIGAGSQAEYGVTDEKLTPSLRVAPSSGYGIAKFAAGRLSSLKAAQLGMRHSWARILSVYGENDGANTLISYLIGALKRGETPKLTKCEQTWDYIYVDDCALALYLIGEKGLDGKSYPIGSGEPKKLSDYVKIVRDAIDPSAEIDFGAKDYYPHQPMFLCADIAELEKDCGFKPQFSFEQGIRRTISSYKKEQN